MRAFVHEGLPAYVTFGRGSIATLPDALARAGIARPLLLSTPFQAAQAVAAIGGRSIGHFTDATMHTPVDITERALALARDKGADGFIAFGGGSTIGLGKALALRTALPQIAIPTTYAGSEMTPILGQTEGGRKTTQRTLKVLPPFVIYDVDLTLDLPIGLSGTSGLNAMAHAVEGLYAREATPLLQLMAEEGIRVFARALPRIVADGHDRDARENALYGAWLCGMVLASAGMALHHKLCHTLGGDFDLPHAETHAIVLPHAVAYNAPAIPEAMAALRRALGSDDPAAALYAIGRAVGVPGGLRAIGMPEAGIDSAADHAIENAYWNPQPLARDAIRALIARAWAGEPPA